MSVLDSIVRSTRGRVRNLPRGERVREAHLPNLEKNLRGRQTVSILAEIKRASPSRGAIAENTDAVTQALRYADAGAAGLSVLTEPDHFGGSLADLEAVASAVDLPVLMKDFFIDPEQVRVAALLGASAFLVLLRITSDSALDELLSAGEEYGLTALLEAHDEAELERAQSRTGLIGINNRNLRTLEVKLSTFDILAPRVSTERVLIAESGYSSGSDLRALRGRADAALVGTALMQSEDAASFLREATA